MGILDAFFGIKVTNPTLVNAIQAYKSNPADDNLINLWQQFFKAKLVIATTADGAKVLAKAKNIKEGISQPCQTINTDKGEPLVAAFADSEAFLSYCTAKTAHVVLSGEQIYALASGKGLTGIHINPRSSNSIELKIWQCMVYIEKVTDARKLQANAAKALKANNFADAEGVLKGAIVAAQRDPGPFHPFTAELNVELARAMEKQQKYTEAEWVYKKALQCYEGSGQQDLNVAKTSEALGFLFKLNGKSSSAFPPLTRALEIYESVPGGKPDSVAKILLTLAEIREEEGKEDEAEQLYKRAAVGLEERKHPDLCNVINKLACFCERQGRTKEAISNYRRSIQMWIAEKSKPSDLADAEHKLSLLLIEEKKFVEATELLRKAADRYKSLGEFNLVKELETRISEVADKKEEEPAPAKAAAGGGARAAASARPGTELPYLDAANKGKGGAKKPWSRDQQPAEDEEEPAKPATPEDEALEKMRSFLDSYDTEPGEPNTVARAQTVRQSAPEPAPPPEPVKNTEENLRQMRSFLSNYDETAQGQPSEVEPTSGKTLISESKLDAAFDSLLGAQDCQADRFDIPIAERLRQSMDEPIKPQGAEQAEAKTLIQEAKVDAAFDTLLAGKTPVSDRYDTPISERLKQSMDEPIKPAAAALAAEPTQSKQFIQEAKVDAAFDTLLAGKTPVSDRYDTAISERLKQSMDEPIKPGATAPAAEAAPSKQFIQEAKVDAAFDTLLAGKTPVSDRYDTPISERLKQSMDEPIKPGATAPAAEAAPSKQFIQEAKVDAAFDTLLAGKTPVSDRYDTPISERLKQSMDEPIKPGVTAPAAEAAPTKQFIQEAKVDAAFDTLLAGKTPVSDRYDTPISERLKQSMDEPMKADFEPPRAAPAQAKGFIQESKVDAAFDSLLAGNTSGSDRFDIPVAERLKQSMDEPLKPAEARQVDAAFDNLLCSNDQDRFDVPVSERSSQPKVPAEPKSRSLIQDAKVDAAFDTLLAGKTPVSDRFDTPIADRLKQQQQSWDDAHSKPLAHESRVDAAFDNLLSSDGPGPVPEIVEAPSKSLISESKLDQAFDNLLGGQSSDDRFETPISQRKAEDIDACEQRKSNELLSETALDAAFDNIVAESVEAQPEPKAVEADAGQSAPPVEAPDTLSSLTAEPEEDEADAFSRLLFGEDELLNPVPPDTVSEQSSSTLSSTMTLTPEQELEHFERLLEGDDDKCELLIKKGSLLLSMDRLEDAMKCFDKVTTQASSNYAGWYYKGSCMRRRNCYEDALYCFNHALRLNPYHTRSLLEKAESLVKLGRAELGIAAYEKLLIIEPHHVQAWLEKAQILILQFKFKDALSCYEQVLELEPEHAEALRGKENMASELETLET